MSFSHKFERNNYIDSLQSGYYILKLEILLHLLKKKITTTPQLKEQTQFVIFFPLTMRPANSYGLGFVYYMAKLKQWKLERPEFQGHVLLYLGLGPNAKSVPIAKRDQITFLLSFFGLETSILKGKVTGSNISCPYCQVVNLIYI